MNTLFPCAALALLLTASAQAQDAPKALTITVQPGARQSFNGLGASLFRFTPSSDYNRQLTRTQQRALPQMLWHDARFRSIRLWIHPDDFLPALNAGTSRPMWTAGWRRTSCRTPSRRARRG